MANYKITDLTELASTPTNGDWIPLVDTSDTSMAPTGTTKRIDTARVVFQDGGTATLTGSLGVGTVTPGVKLHVVGVGEIGRLTTTSATGDVTASFSQNSARRGNFGFEDTNQVVFLSSWYGDLVLRAAATANSNTPTEYLRIKAGGNVGIGTASPTAKLDVAGTVQMDALRIDQPPTSGAVTLTHYINVSLNGTNYRIPCGTA